MKIEGTGPIRPQNIKRTSRTSGAAGASFAGMINDVDDAESTAASASVAGANPLFALQEVSDATTRQRRARQRGTDILDRLDDLRVSLLTGEVSKDRLEGLVSLVQGQRDAVDDPALTTLLDEIDLRARVELAKLSIDV